MRGSRKKISFLILPVYCLAKLPKSIAAKERRLEEPGKFSKFNRPKWDSSKRNRENSKNRGAEGEKLEKEFMKYMFDSP